MNGMFCGPCTQQMLVNAPSALTNHRIDWLGLLERQVPYTCLACGPVYYAAKIVEESPDTPPFVRGLAAVVCFGLLAITADRLVGEFIGYLKG